MRGVPTKLGLSIAWIHVRRTKSPAITRRAFSSAAAAASPCRHVGRRASLPLTGPLYPRRSRILTKQKAVAALKFRVLKKTFTSSLRTKKPAVCCGVEFKARLAPAPPWCDQA